MIETSLVSAKGRGSFISNLSISNKIFLSFIFIALLFIGQSFISINSINELDHDYVLSQNLNTVDEQSRLIIGLHRYEALQYSKRVLGIETHDSLATIFSTLKNNTDTSYDELEKNILIIGREMDTEIPNELISNITAQKEPYYDIASSIFNFPGISILDDLTQLTESINLGLNKLSRNIHAQAHTLNISYYTSTFFEDYRSINDTITQFQFTYSNDNYDLEKINPESYKIKQDFYLDLFDSFTTLRSKLSVMNGMVPTAGNFTSMPISNYLIFNQTVDDLQLLFTNFDIDIGEFESHISFEKESILGLFNEANQFLETMNTEFSKLQNWSSQKQIGLVSEFSDTVTFIVGIVFFVIFLTTIFVVLILFLVNSQIASPIKTITKWSEQISDGDLSKTRKSLNREDEIGVLHANFKEMSKNLRQVIGDVKDTAGLISSTAENLSSNTEEINATAEEISAIAQSMARGSLQQAELITSIVDELQSTTKIVDKVISQINKNLGVIRDLSEQTNVLSLNTAIEAANAGDFGKGFVIIAENIRKMSEQSRQTSTKITKDSKEVLNQLQFTFNTITEKIENVASVSQETAASAEEVAASAQEMTATMENVSTTSAVLNDQSFKSLNLVNKFVI